MEFFYILDQQVLNGEGAAAGANAEQFVDVNVEQFVDVNADANQGPEEGQNGEGEVREG